jgi:hypothetical protein
MWTMTKRVRRTLPLAAGLVLGACGDEVTGPRRGPTGLAGGASAVARSERIPNAVKYRDAGHKPATGRSGGASITVRALLGRTGTTELEVYAGQLGSTGPGELKKVQLKLFDTTGAQLATTNYNGLTGASAVFALHGLARDRRFQVQANVQGADGPRTGVVTVADVVKLRPDLAVSSLSAAPTTLTGLPTTITAVVQELNGDVGARADCVLDVDGTPVDSAAGIWVDAGGTVSCAFAHAFAMPGTFTVRARVVRADPGDFDVGNDSASRTIVVVREVPFSSFTASARTTTQSRWTEYTWDVTTGGRGWREAGSVRNTYGGATQDAYFEAFIRHPIAFPADAVSDVQVSQETHDTTVHAAAYEQLAVEDSSIGAVSARWCVEREAGAGIVASLSICSYRSTFSAETTWYTRVVYEWRAGDVTYFSVTQRLLMCWYPYQCTPGSYSWNTTNHQVTGRLVTFGPDYTIRVAFTAGFERYMASAVIPLRPVRLVNGRPLECTGSWRLWAPAGTFAHVVECSGDGLLYSSDEGSVSG